MSHQVPKKEATGRFLDCPLADMSDNVHYVNQEVPDFIDNGQD